MKFGLLYEMQRPHTQYKVDYTALIEETLEQCILADEVGFDYLWFVEHHFLTTFSGSSAPEVIVSALARLTQRIRLGFGVIVLPHHHPVQVSERLAMIDHLSGGRVEFGVGRSSPYEQIGLGVDPRDTRGMMLESLQIIPKIWQANGNFEWDGQYFTIPPREVLPTPKQDPHPPIWMACTQQSSYELAAANGVGVLSFATSSPANLKQHVDDYRINIKNATPAGAFVNNQWANFTLGHCGDNDSEAMELGAESIKAFFGPDRPYTADRVDIYQNLLDAWGGVPNHLQANFDRFLGGGEPDLGGGNAPRSALGQLPAELLAERGVIVAGNPDTCINCVKQHAIAGVDQTLLIMQTDQIPHQKVLRSIELFGKEVIPAFS